MRIAMYCHGPRYPHDVTLTVTDTFRRFSMKKKRYPEEIETGKFQINFP